MKLRCLDVPMECGGHKVSTQVVALLRGPFAEAKSHLGSCPAPGRGKDPLWRVISSGVCPVFCGLRALWKDWDATGLGLEQPLVPRFITLFGYRMLLRLPT